MTEQEGKGFSGLSKLVSTPALPSERDPEPVPLIELTKWPSMASIWSSSDAGETWVWGDYVLTFQREPETVASVAARMAGGKQPPRTMRYLYAVSVFYRREKCPFGPTSRPILSVGVEQLDVGAMLSGAGLDTAADLGRAMPPMVGMFRAESRSNLGEYTGPDSPVAVRKLLFEYVGRTLEPKGSLEKIGTLDNAFGDPRTGLPARRAKQGDWNCFIATAAFGGADDPVVSKLRAFRDETLLRTGFGRCFVAVYYRLSPPLARSIEQRPALRRWVRVLLRVLVTALPDCALERPAR